MKKIGLGLLALLLFFGGYQAFQQNDLVHAEVETIEIKQIKNEEMLVHYIDTGNSDCILIQTETKNVLIDAGDNDDETFVVDYLKKCKIKTIDYLISTHPDADHSGGLDAVVKNFEIKETLISNGSSDTKTYQDFVHSLADKGLTPAVPLANKQFELGKNSYMQFYNTQAKGSGNEVSLITLVVNKNNKFLFMGDAESKQEKSVLKDLPDVDVLKVGHHGSKTSTSKELLKQVKPEVAVILCGTENKYGHPHQEVLSNLDSVKAKVYRSDLNGTIRMNSNGTKIDTSTMKNTIIKETMTKETDNTVSQNYIGNKNSMKYHKLDCKTLPDKKNQVMLDSKEMALKLNYQPCGNCKP